MTVPNAVTLLRICLTPSVIYFLYFPKQTAWGLPYTGLALGIFLLIALSDALDGFLARKFDQVSTLGKFLDPLADKILVIAVLLVLLAQQVIPVAPVLIIVIRDLIISVFRGLAASQNKVIAADVFGKTKTVIEIIAVVMLLSNWPLAVDVLWFAAVISALSGAKIIWNNRSALN